MLHTARELGRGTVADLIVACWQRWPRWFGLAGYEDRYPHAQSVMSKMYGERGLIANQLMFDDGESRWAVPAPANDNALLTAAPALPFALVSQTAVLDRYERSAQAFNAADVIWRRFEKLVCVVDTRGAKPVLLKVCGPLDMRARALLNAAERMIAQTAL